MDLVSGEELFPDSSLASSAAVTIEGENRLAQAPFMFSRIYSHQSPVNTITF